MKTALAILAILMIPGLAAAGANIHLETATPAGAHTVDVQVDDAGNASILVDGQPLGAPSAPGLPGVPTLPALPAPGVPSAPELPALPTLP